ncbi:MAG: pyruvate ferredoxin oxidoreductase, partial [candidate division WOR-3 bacterium]
RLAVETGVFPLYEVVNGKYRLTVEIPKLRPVTDYLKPQGRFRHLFSGEAGQQVIAELQRYVDEQWELLLRKQALFGEESAKA